ncbi:hypothetical protein [Flavitalea sp.]|nr:hypothetical protein [Flavitalea sp.]
MSDILELPVHYQNEELVFGMEMINWGYTHRFKIIVNGLECFFEPDEEGVYRAVSEDYLKHASQDTELLKVIGETLGELMR